MTDRPQGRCGGRRDQGMKERALALGGDVEVTESPLGGAEVRLSISGTRPGTPDDHAAEDTNSACRRPRVVREVSGGARRASRTSRWWRRPRRRGGGGAGARPTDVHLAILDIAMPRMTGLQAARELSRRRPDLRILILSMYDKEQYFFEALPSGASGYVLKRAADRDIVEACRTALRGEPFLYPDACGADAPATSKRCARGETPGRRPADPARVRDRQADRGRAQLAGDRRRCSSSARRRSSATGRTCFEKLGMHDRVDLTRYAIRRGLVEP